MPTWLNLTPAWSSRFWSKIDVQNSYECHNWTAGLSGGYGIFHPANIKVNGKWKSAPKRAHVLVWELTYGPIPEGQCVLHKCDNRKCCNPNHLFLGTRGDNIRDCAKKLRHGRARLDPTTVKLIRYRRKEGFSLAQISEELCISKRTISDIVYNKTWVHLLEDNDV